MVAHVLSVSPSPTSSHFPSSNSPSPSPPSSHSSLPSPTSTSASHTPTTKPTTPAPRPPPSSSLSGFKTPMEPRGGRPSLSSSASPKLNGLAIPAPPSPSPSASSFRSTPAPRPSRRGGPFNEDDSLAVNPLYSLGERVTAGEIAPNRIVINKDGVVVRAGDGSKSPARWGRGGRGKNGKETPPKTTVPTEGQRAGWPHLFHHRGVHHTHATNGNGNGASATPKQQEDSETDSEGKKLEGFKDNPYEQDQSDKLRMKVRQAKQDAREKLQEGGWRTPEVEKGEEEVLEPRLKSMLERKELLNGGAGGGESDTNGGGSFYATASEAGGVSATATDVESSPASLPSVPPRSDSPISCASLSETTPPAPSQPQFSPPTAIPANSHAPIASSSRLSPLLENSPHAPRQPRTSSLYSSTSPARSAPAGSPSLPLGYTSTPSYLSPSHASARRPSDASANASPPTLSTTPPTMRRSHTTGSPPLLAAAEASSSTLSVPSTVPFASSSGQRRMSSAGSSGRVRGSSFIGSERQQRSNSYSPSPQQHASLYQHPSTSTHQQHPPFSPSSAPVRSPSMQLDDVETSIAAQAEAIRRQRQEKRAEADREAAKAEREREREVREPPASSSGRENGGGLGVGGLAGPGALLKRRSTRTGSGSSQQEQILRPGTATGAAAGKAKEVDPAAAMAASSSAGGAGEGLAGNSEDAAPVPTPLGGRLARAAGVQEEDLHPGGAGAAGVLVGNLIGQDHANYVLMYNMLTGIRIGVSRCQAKPRRELTDADYTARHKFSFDIVGNELTPSVKYDFKFKDYAPWVFRELREYFYLDPSDYLVSLTAKYILSELGSPGKSGSFFYFSRDYRFIIKTIRHSEHKFLRSILKDYHEYVKKNPHTLISRFYGLHRVKLPHGKKIHFVIMNNLFPPHRDIHETYDLKGSAIGRLYPEDRAAQNPHAVLKDLNWVIRHRQLALGPEKKALFEEQLRRDTELLQKLRIMDYSLLTGIHNGVRGNSEGLREDKLSVFQPATVKVSRKPTQIKRDADASALRKAVQRSDPRALGGVHELPEQDTSERRLFLFYQDEGGMLATGDNNEDLGVIYYLGIIDILTPYTVVKRLEHFFKGMKHDKHMISAVPPKEYGDRFLAFIRSCIRGNDESTRPRMFEKESEERELEKQAPPPNVSEDDEKVQQRAQEEQEGGGGGGPPFVVGGGTAAEGGGDDELRRKEQ